VPACALGPRLKSESSIEGDEWREGLPRGEGVEANEREPGLTDTEWERSAFTGPTACHGRNEGEGERELERELELALDGDGGGGRILPMLRARLAGDECDNDSDGSDGERLGDEASVSTS